MRIAFICNQRAGSGRRRKEVDGMVAYLGGLGHETKVFLSTGDPGAAARMAIHAGFEVIVAVGGDGTVSACAGAVWKSGAPRVLGVVPAGTLNHFAKDLGITDFATAQVVLAQQMMRTVDIATVNGFSFVNNASIGLYPVIVRKREFSRNAGVPRWWAFADAVLRSMVVHFPVRRLQIEADGRWLLHRTPFLFVGNNAYWVEGIRIGTRARLDAGVLGVCSSGSRGPFTLMRLAFRALVGRIREERDFLNITAHRVKVRSPHSSLQISLDGELFRLRTPLEYEVHAGELRVLVRQADR